MIETKIKIADMKWSSSGDYIIQNGDIADTSRTVGSGFLQEVQDRIKSSVGDWKLVPNRGAGLELFKGRQNDEDLWEDIKTTIGYSLTRDLFLNRQDFQILIIPIDDTGIAIRIDFNLSLTTVAPDSTIIVKIVYDLEGQGPFITA